MNSTNDYVLNIDINKGLSSVVPTFKQGDTGSLSIILFDRGKLVDLNKYTNYEISIKLPNEEIHLDTPSLKNGTIYYQFNNLYTSEKGIVEVNLSLFDNKILKIKPFDILIHDSNDELSYVKSITNKFIDNKNIISNIKYNILSFLNILPETPEMNNPIEIDTNIIFSNDFEKINELQRDWLILKGGFIFNNKALVGHQNEDNLMIKQLSDYGNISIKLKFLNSSCYDGLVFKYKDENNYLMIINDNGKLLLACNINSEYIEILELNNIFKNENSIIEVQLINENVKLIIDDSIQINLIIDILSNYSSCGIISKSENNNLSEFNKFEVRKIKGGS